MAMSPCSPLAPSPPVPPPRCSARRPDPSLSPPLLCPLGHQHPRRAPLFARARAAARHVRGRHGDVRLPPCPSPKRPLPDPPPLPCAIRSPEPLLCSPALSPSLSSLLLPTAPSSPSHTTGDWSLPEPNGDRHRHRLAVLFIAVQGIEEGSHGSTAPSPSSSSPAAAPRARFRRRHRTSAPTGRTHASRVSSPLSWTSPFIPFLCFSPNRGELAAGERRGRAHRRRALASPLIYPHPYSSTKQHPTQWLA